LNLLSFLYLKICFHFLTCYFSSLYFSFDHEYHLIWICARGDRPIHYTNHRVFCRNDLDQKRRDLRPSWPRVMSSMDRKRTEIGALVGAFPFRSPLAYSYPLGKVWGMGVDKTVDIVVDSNHRHHRGSLVPFPCLVPHSHHMLLASSEEHNKGPPLYF
jgi:hypothetical protein